MQPDIKYLLLDLDGTLIHFDMREFVNRYLKMITLYFKSYSWSEHVSSWILEGTDLMLNNQGPEANQEIFLRFFSSKSGLSEDDIWDKFIHFYENEFDRLRTITVQNQPAKEFLEQAITRNCKLVLATQPIFPEIAIRKRLEWAGLSHIPFCLITDIERMSASKPSLEYFVQILRHTGAKSGECLMIGNDPMTDMAASNAGINTFHFTDDLSITLNPLFQFSGNFRHLSHLLGWK